MQEKMNIDEILLQQEEKIKELTTYNENLKNELDSKKDKLNEGDKNIFNLVKVFEKQKKSLNFFKNKIKNLEKEYEENKLIILEKDHEIIYIRNYLNTLKADRKKIISNFIIFYNKFKFSFYF
jgi:hypothetical protein